MYSFPKYKKNGNQFGPTEKKHFYIPVHYHNKSASQNERKTKWVLKQGEQYEVFRISDEGEWNCKVNKGLFSILSNGNEILGENEERLAFFPNPQNSSDSWHGFPISSADYDISDELIKQWINAEVIDIRISIKILKGQL